MTKHFDDTYKNAYQKERPSHEDFILFYKGKKGYRDWAMDYKTWKNHGLQVGEYEEYAYLDLHKCDIVDIKAREICQDLEMDRDYIVFLTTSDGERYATVRSTSACGKYFCDPATVAYIPMRNIYG